MTSPHHFPLGEGGWGIDTNYLSNQSPLPSSPRGKLLRSKWKSTNSELTAQRRCGGVRNSHTQLIRVLALKAQVN